MEWIYPILGKQKCLVSHQFLYTQSGRGSLHVGGEQFILEGGSLFYLGPGIPHEYYPLKEGEWTTCWVVFRGEYLNELMKGMGFDAFVYDKNVVNDKIVKIFHQLLGVAKDPLYGDEYCSVKIF